MMLREELRRRLLEERGIYVKECCDQCGQLLGPVRYTRKNESGVWCSRECRDGEEAHALGKCQGCGATLEGKRRGAKWCGEYCRRNPGLQSGPNREIIPPTPLQNKGLTEPKTASLALGLNPASLVAA